MNTTSLSTLSPDAVAAQQILGKRGGVAPDVAEVLTGVASVDLRRSLSGYAQRFFCALRSDQHGFYLDNHRAAVVMCNDHLRARGIPVAPNHRLIAVPNNGSDSLLGSMHDAVDSHRATRRAIRSIDSLYGFAHTDALKQVGERARIPVAGNRDIMGVIGNKGTGLEILNQAGIDVPSGRLVRSVEEARAVLHMLMSQYDCVGAALKESDGVTGIGIHPIGMARVGSGEEDEAIRRLPVPDRKKLLRDDFEQLCRNDAIIEQLRREAGMRLEVWLSNAAGPYRGEILGSPSIGIAIAPDGRMVEMGISNQFLNGGIGHKGNIDRSPLSSELRQEVERQLRDIGTRYAQVLRAYGHEGPASIDTIVLRQPNGTIRVIANDPNTRLNGPAHGFLTKHDICRITGIPPEELTMAVGTVNITHKRPVTPEQILAHITAQGWDGHIETLRDPRNTSPLVLPCNLSTTGDGFYHAIVIGPNGEHVEDVFLNGAGSIPVQNPLEERV